MDKMKGFQIIVVLSLLAIGADVLLTYNKVTDSAVGCQAGGGCDIVAGSIYSEFMGIPVSLFGLAAFLFFILISILALYGKLPVGEAYKILFIVSALGLIPAAYFVYVMFFVLEAICPYCLFSHLMLLLIVGVSYKGRESFP